MKVFLFLQEYLRGVYITVSNIVALVANHHSKVRIALGSCGPKCGLFEP